MRRHFLRVLKRTAVGELGGDPGCAECVAANFRCDAGRRGAPADHAPGSVVTFDLGSDGKFSYKDAEAHR